MSKTRLLAPAALVFALAACGPATGVNTAGTNKATASAKPGTVKTTTTTSGKNLKFGEVKGSVFGPKGYKLGNGAPPVGKTSADLPTAKTSTDPGPNLAITGANERFEEGPLAGVEVYLASKKGERFAGPSIGVADASGNFTIKNVPLDLGFLIMTDATDPSQRHKELCGVMQTVASAGDVKISFASTLVTINTVNAMPGNAIGTFTADLYVKLTTAVESQLKTMVMKELPDVSDINSVTAFMAKVSVNGQPATKLIGDLRTSLAANGVDANTLNGYLSQISFQGTGQANVNGQQVAGGNTAGTLTMPPDLMNAIFGTPAATPTPAPDPIDAPAADVEATGTASI